MPTHRQTFPQFPTHFKTVSKGGALVSLLSKKADSGTKTQTMKDDGHVQGSNRQAEGVDVSTEIALRRQLVALRSDLDTAK